MRRVRSHMRQASRQREALAIPCRAAAARDMLCAALGLVDPDEVWKCLTACVVCSRLLDS